MTASVVPVPGDEGFAADEPAPPTIGSVELERLTGVRGERIRTWVRRFGFPETTYRGNGTRRFAVDDVPRVLAARQLIESGEPVASAMAIVKAGLPAPDTAALVRSFAGVQAPVTAWQGPEPLQLLWANAAAYAAAEGQAITPPERSRFAYRTLQRVMVPADGTCVTLEHPSLCASGDEACRLVAWTVGPPAFAPAVAVVMELPALVEGEDAPPEPTTGRSDLDPHWPAAVGQARRALQRGGGASALSDALIRLLDGTGARDAVVIREQGHELLPARWSRGLRPTPGLADAAAVELRRAAGLERPMWLTDATCAQLTGEQASGCLAVPLTVSGVCSGYLVLEFSDRIELPNAAEELLLAFGAAVAASIGRDRAIAVRRRLAGQPVG